MKKPGFGKNGILAAAMVLTAMTGCVEVYTRIPVLDIGENGTPSEQWGRYGAYYIADDLIISVNNTANPGPGQAEFTVFKKIRILTAQGLRWATIPVWHHTDHLALFECTIVDSAGNRHSLETSVLRSNYETSGNVAVPGVVPGSTIILKMVFTQSRAPADYEHWFTRTIPVQTGRLVVHTDEGMHFTYEHAVYGMRVRPREAEIKQFGGRTVCWQVKDLEPAADSIHYKHRASESEPRIELRINPLYGTHGNAITQWNEMAGFINQLVIDPIVEGSEDEIAAKAAQITRGKRNNRTRAAAIVEWVQQNVTCTLAPAKAKVADILHGAPSDMIAVSVVCKQLLKSAGISSHLILTRAHSRGGFDSTMLSYSGCREGFLVVKFDTVEYVVAPAYAGYPIGTYPADFFDLYGLNLDSFKPVKLPAPRWGRYDERSHVTLSLSSDTAVQTMCMSFHDLSMPPVRRRLEQHSGKGRQEVVERMLHRHGDRNTLLSFSLQGLGDYDPALAMTCRFRSNIPLIDAAGAKRFDLSSFFTRIYGDIDSARQEDIVISVPVVHIDTLEIIKESGTQVSLDASAWQCEDSLFSARLSVEHTASSVLLIRDIETRRCVIPRPKIAAIVTDIRALDRASTVAAVMKTAGKKK